MKERRGKGGEGRKGRERRGEERRGEERRGGRCCPGLLKLKGGDRKWLPVEQRFIFKRCALMHLVHTGRGPSYLCDLVTLTSDIASGSRQKSRKRYELPATRLKTGERCFSFSGPAAWNSLLASLHVIPDCKSLKRQLQI
jgi:hypothetical protein